MDSERPALDRVARRPRRALGDPRHRDHGQAVSVVRRHASDARRAPRPAAARRVHRATTSSAIDVGVDPIAPTILIYDRPVDRARREVQHAVLRRGRGRARPRRRSRRSTTALRDDPAIVAMQARVTMRVDPSLDGVGAAADAGARHRPAARRPRADRAAPTARAATRAAGAARRSWRRSSCRARAARCLSARPARRSRRCARSRSSPTCAIVPAQAVEPDPEGGGLHPEGRRYILELWPTCRAAL